MKKEYYPIKWIDDDTVERRTKEVFIEVKISGGGTRMVIYGEGDLEHHLIEDTAILMNKIAEVKCGHKVG